MTQNDLKHILNRSLKNMEFDIADPPPPIMEFSLISFFFNEGFPYLLALKIILIFSIKGWGENFKKWCRCRLTEEINIYFSYVI